jgi:hypothetical protein
MISAPAVDTTASRNNDITRDLFRFVFPFIFQPSEKDVPLLAILRIVELRLYYGNSGGVLKVPLLATLLTDSRKYAIYDNMTSFSQFQEKNAFLKPPYDAPSPLNTRWKTH